MKPIVCKPKLSAYFSVGLVLLICYAWLIYLLVSTMQLAQVPWWRYLLMSLVAGFATILSIRLFGNFKVITATSQQLMVRWPLLWKKKSFELTALEGLDVQQVKTPTGLYEQLLVQFSQQTIKIGNQEYEQYERLKKFLQQRKNSPSHPKASKRKWKGKK